MMLNNPSVFLQNENGHKDQQILKKTRNTAFSPGEVQVLHMIGDGYTNAQIATALKISVRTIETRRASMMRKSGATNSATLIRYAMRNNLLT